MKFFTQFSFAWIISLYWKNCWLAAQWDTKYTLWVYEPPTAAYQMIQDRAGIRMIQSPYHAREQWLSILIFFCNWKALFASMIWRLNHSKVFSQSQYIHLWHFSTLSFWKTGTYEGYFIEGSNTIYIDETGLTTNLKCSHFWVAKDLRNCSGYSFQPFANPINHSFYYPQASCFKI